MQKEYTSARLNSKFAFKYGRVEVRAKLPSVAGTWPAIWLLGKNIEEDGTYWDNLGYDTSPWPFCGEIDIMEPDVAKTQILGTWHWNNGGGYMYNSLSVPLSNSEASQNFHDYVLEWDEDSMRIYLDNTLINEMPSVDPFNQEFFILLNVAMGGSLGGSISPSFTEDTMEIDYVKVYQKSTLSANDTLKSKVVFSPNPVSEVLSIRIGDTLQEEVGLQIIELNGRIVLDTYKKVNGGMISINASNLHSGFYIARLTQNNGNRTSFKFIKK